MASKVLYKASIAGDLRRLDKPMARRLTEKLEQVLGANPDAGTSLTGDVRGLFRYRMGDYRVIYTKTAEGVLVLRIAHRSKVYRTIL